MRLIDKSELQWIGWAVKRSAAQGNGSAENRVAMELFRRDKHSEGKVQIRNVAEMSGIDMQGKCNVVRGPVEQRN